MDDDTDEWFYITLIGGIVLGAIIFHLLTITFDNNDGNILLGQGFANQTCIDKGLVLDKVTLDNDLPKIICKNLEHIDGTRYTIAVRG